LGVELAEGGSTGGGFAGQTMQSTGGANSGGGNATSGGVAATSGGVAATAGAGMGGPPCFPERSLPEGDFAESRVVYERLAQFILGQPALPPGVPVATTREWAGATALALLESMEVPFAATRFLSKWSGLASEPTPESLDWASRWSPLVSGPDWDFRNVVANDGEPGRAGILTDEELLQRNQSPSSRGAWTLVNLMCAQVPPPPAELDIALPPLPAGVSRRQYFEGQLATQPVCAGCHRMMDPVGFAFEHFDEDAIYRTVDNGVPVDSSGEFTGSHGSRFTFTSVVDLGPQLISSCEAARCIAERMTGDALRSAGLPDRVASVDELDHIANEFARSGFSTKTLISTVAKTPTLLR
jgi:hypothetical protein